jgi:hypothetical protein
MQPYHNIRNMSRMSLIEIEQLKSAYETDKKQCESIMCAFEQYMMDDNYTQDFDKCVTALHEFKFFQDKPKMVILATNVEMPGGVFKGNGPRVQMYKPDDLTSVVQVFPSITEAVRTVKDSSYSQIKVSSNNNLVYLGHRWNLLHCASDDATVAAIMEPTVETKQVRKVDRIAMMDIEKTCIIKVFLKQKDAAEYVNQVPSAICTALRFKSPIANHAWAFLGDVQADILEAWTRDNEMPEALPNKRGLQVQQIDPVTNQIIKVFASITDVVKAMQMSPKTIKQCVVTKKPYKGYLWNFVENV